MARSETTVHDDPAIASTRGLNENSTAADSYSKTVGLLESSEPKAEDITECNSIGDAQSRQSPDPRSRSSRSVTSRTESQSTIQDSNSGSSGLSGHERGLIKRVPFFRCPIPGKGQKWHADDHTPSQWSSLFYDLVLVACLTVFGSTHELSKPDDIPIFLGYFAIIYWIWVSQVHYDTRYEGHDGVHRVWKFIQVCVYLFIGAASGAWDPGNIQTAQSHAITGIDAIEIGEAEQSFQTIVLAFAVSRVQLALQYATCALVGRKSRRSVSPHWVSVATLTLSSGLSIAAALIVSWSSGLVALRLVLVYGAIAMEMIVAIIQLVRESHVSVPVGKVQERYGCFLLIILGDGLLDIARALNQAISALSDSMRIYTQAFMATLIVYMLWSFLCGDSDEAFKSDERHGRSWDLLQFTTKFCLLLLLGAIVNVIFVISNGTGTVGVINEWTGATQFVKSGGTLTEAETGELGKYLYRLRLQPEWTTQLEQLEQLWAENNPSQSPDLIDLQYLGQIATSAFGLYGVDIPNETYEIYQTLTSLDARSNAVTNQTLAEATTMVNKIIDDTFTDALSGILWLYPAAGIVLIQCACRTVLWSQATKSRGQLISIYFHTIGGVALALLGLLDIGHKQFTFTYDDVIHGEAPIYLMVPRELPLVVVSVVYVVVYLGPVVVQELVHRWKGGVYVEEMED